MKRDILVIRLIAASLATTFGSLWVAFYISGMVAPPEPEIATIGRHLCLVLFFVTFIWSMALYSAFRKEERIRRSAPANSERAE